MRGSLFAIGADQLEDEAQLVGGVEIGAAGGAVDLVDPVARADQRRAEGLKERIVRLHVGHAEAQVMQALAVLVVKLGMERGIDDLHQLQLQFLPEELGDLDDEVGGLAAIDRAFGVEHPVFAEAFLSDKMQKRRRGFFHVVHHDAELAGLGKVKLFEGFVADELIHGKPPAI